MKARRLWRKVVRAGNVKQLAVDIGGSASMLYKMGEEGGSGRRNPLELLTALYRSTGDRRLVKYLSQEHGGYFVANPPAVPPPPDEALRQALGRFHHDHASLERVMAAAETAGGFTPAEIKRLRKRWEKFKSHTEGLVRDAERGRFKRQLPA